MIQRIESAPPTFISSARLIEGFQANCRIRGMAAGSIPRHLSIIKIFCEYLNRDGINLIDVDRDVLRGFLEYLRLERDKAIITLLAKTGIRRNELITFL